MTGTFVNKNIVFVSKFSPEVLNPDFLKLRGIIDDSWRLDEPPISTPVFSILKFANGIVISIQNERLEVVEGKLPQNLGNSRLVEVATKIYKVFEASEFKNMGQNGAIVVSSDQISSNLVEKFLKSGPWNNKDRTPKTIQLQFKYDLDDNELNLTLGDGNARFIKDGIQVEIEGVIINGNYHLDIRDKSSEEIIQLIGNFENRMTSLQNVVDEFFREETN